MLGAEEEFIVALEREQILVCEQPGRYAPAMIERLRFCQSLHEDLGVNLEGLAVAMQLLETIRAERRQFHEVLALLQRELASRE
jgi:hypothetical protein